MILSLKETENVLFQSIESKEKTVTVLPIVFLSLTIQNTMKNF